MSYLDQYDAYLSKGPLNPSGSSVSPLGNISNAIIFNPISESTQSQSINSGSQTEPTFAGKKSFTDPSDGYWWGFDPITHQFMWIVGALGQSVDFNVTTPGAFTINVPLIATNVQYGKTSFADSTHAGYYISSSGVYFGAAGNSTYLKYDIGSATLDFVGRSVIASTTSNLGAAFFGDGSDGDVTLGAGTTTLSRDMYYNNLTIPNGATLKTNCYRIFVKNTLTTTGTGNINNNGLNGTNGTDASGLSKGTAGSPGGALTAGTLPGTVIPGNSGNGGDGYIVPSSGNPGVDGTNGTGVTKGMVAAGVNGTGPQTSGGAGAGGGSSGGGPGGGFTSGLAGTGGALSGTIYNTPNSPQSVYSLFDWYPAFTAFTISGSAGGSGGGGSGVGIGLGARSGAGGGGGGAGSPGGAMFIAARYIVNNGTISANGGAGGNGGNGSAATVANAGGGGGGCGGSSGNGGIIFLIYNSFSGNAAIASAGTPGTGGTGGAGAGTGVVGVNGQTGITGAAGKVITLNNL